jgi:hypothetical protein
MLAEEVVLPTQHSPILQVLLPVRAEKNNKFRMPHGHALKPM